MSDDSAASLPTVVITGASRGIGEACVAQLADRGFRVVAGVRSSEHGDALVRRFGDAVVPLILDVTDAEAIAAARTRVQQQVGDAGLAGLVNNAGIAVAGPLEFLPVPQLREQLEVNVIGAIAVTQAFLDMLRRGGGRIVNVGSIAGRSALAFVGPYSASKFALEAITDALRVELRPWGLHVAVVEPGSVATEIWDRSAARAARLASDYPPDVRRLYGGVLDRMRELTQRSKDRGMPADVVARAVAHALTARRPRARYLLGRDAHVRAALEWLPTRLRDWIYGRVLYGRG